MVPPEQRAVIRQLAARLACDPDDTDHNSRERVVIHGDFTNDNVIADGTPPSATGVIDFALAHAETPLADIGYGLWRSGRPHERADHLDSVIRARYAQRGGYTPAEQQRREQLRLEAAARFACGGKISQIAHDLRVTPGSVRRWHRAWEEGGTGALRSRGPVPAERLSARQWARLELELGKGPLAHGFAAGQRWTLGRIKTLIGRLFHVGYTVEGTWKLMRRHGWSCQVPVRQAMERGEEAVAVQ